MLFKHNCTFIESKHKNGNNITIFIYSTFYLQKPVPYFVASIYMYIHWFLFVSVDYSRKLRGYQVTMAVLSLLVVLFGGYTLYRKCSDLRRGNQQNNSAPENGSG